MNMPATALAPLTTLVYATADEDPPHFPPGSVVIVVMDCREGGCLVAGRATMGRYNRKLVTWDALERVDE